MSYLPADKRSLPNEFVHELSSTDTYTHTRARAHAHTRTHTHTHTHTYKHIHTHRSFDSTSTQSSSSYNSVRGLSSSLRHTVVVCEGRTDIRQQQQDRERPVSLMSLMIAFARHLRVPNELLAARILRLCSPARCVL